MTLHYDRYGFIIGEKRFKQLNGNLSEIGHTTKQILSLLSEHSSYDHKIAQQDNHQVNELSQQEQAGIGLHRQLNSTLKRSPINAVPLAIKKSTKSNTKHHQDANHHKKRVAQSDVITNDNTANHHTSDDKTIRKKSVQYQHKKHQSPVKRHVKHSSSDEQSGDNTLSVDEKNLLSNTKKVIQAVEMVNVENISPEIDAIKEIDGIIRPAGRAFVAMGKGAGWLYKRKSKRDIVIPKEQNKQHKLDNLHDTEEIRLYRLILQKLKDGSFGLSNLLGGLTGLGGLDIFDRKKRKKNGGTVVKDGNKDKSKPKPTNKPNAGKKSGIIAKIVAATLGLGALIFGQSKPKPDGETDSKSSHQRSNQILTQKKPNRTPKYPTKNTKPNKQTRWNQPRWKKGTLILSLGTMLGGVMGVVADKFGSFFGKVNDRFDEQNNQSGQVISQDLLIKHQAHQAEYGTALAHTQALTDESSATLELQKTDVNASHITKNSQLEQKASETNKGIESWFDTARSWLSDGYHWVVGGLSSLWEGAKSWFGSMTGGADTNGGGASATKDAHDAVSYAFDKALSKSMELCALYVNNAFRRLGYKAQGHGKDVAKYLIDNNKGAFTEISYSKDYVPVHGDVMSIDHGRHQYGHVAIYDANRGIWISDYKQHKVRGNTAATNDADYQKILSGKAKVTIARNTKGSVLQAPTASIGQQPNSSSTPSNNDFSYGLGSKKNYIEKNLKKDSYGYYLTGGTARHYRYAQAKSSDLVNIEHKKTAGGNSIWSGTNPNSSSVHKEMLPDLERMIDAAAADGIKLSIMSGFRPIGNTPTNGTNSKAPAGGSEHHTGFAVDFAQFYGKTPEQLAKMEEFKWMKRRTHEFGFVQSFTKNNVMGVTQEGWHFKFVGTDKAVRALTPQGGRGAILGDGRVITNGILKNSRPSGGSGNGRQNNKIKASDQPNRLTLPDIPYQQQSVVMANVREPIYPSKQTKEMQSIIQVSMGSDRLPVHTIINHHTYT